MRETNTYKYYDTNQSICFEVRNLINRPVCAIVDFRSIGNNVVTIYTITGRLHIPTRASRQTFGSHVYGAWFGRRALDCLLIRCPASNMENIIISSAHSVAELASSNIALQLNQKKLRQKWYLVQNPGNPILSVR